jgi:hypothetical protein
MRVIVIDAKKFEVRSVVAPDNDESNLPFLRETLGCNMVELVRLNSKLDLWIDEEGSFANGGAPRYFVEIGGLTGLIAGSVVLASHDGPKMTGLPDEVTVAFVKARVQFVVRP